MNDKCFELPNHFSRREFMHVGFIGGLGLSLADFLQIKSHGAQKFYETKDGPAKSVIHIYLPGGMAHQESWDPKPYAPSSTAARSRASKPRSQASISAKTSSIPRRLRTKSPYVVR